MDHAKWAVLAFVSAACLFVAFFAAGPSVSVKDAPVASQNRSIKDADEISYIWEKNVSRYIKVGMPEVDPTVPIAAVFIGVGVIIGTDMFVRRKADNVIKRFRSKNKSS